MIRDNYGCARLAQAVEVRDIHRGIQPHVGVDLSVSFGLATRPTRRRMDDRDRVVLEVAIMDAQAWRGTTSHFNVSTTPNMILFIVMGAAIMLQTIVSVAVAVALWRQRFTDKALGWALRIGMTLTIGGAMIGLLMTRPTQEQLAEAHTGMRMTTSGRTYGRRPRWWPWCASNGLESRAR